MCVHNQFSHCSLFINNFTLEKKRAPVLQLLTLHVAESICEICPNSYIPVDLNVSPRSSFLPLYKTKTRPHLNTRSERLALFLLKKEPQAFLCYTTLVQLAFPIRQVRLGPQVYIAQAGRGEKLSRKCLQSKIGIERTAFRTDGYVGRRGTQRPRGDSNLMKYFLLWKRRSPRKASPVSHSGGSGHLCKVK